MTDQFGRKIEYMRVSITDRCNLRCKYCIPNGTALTRHCDLLTYEEILRVCRLAVGMGIRKFKITGGEPLIRRDACGFMRELKQVKGVEQVTLTTNAMLLERYLPQLVKMGIDGINISLDSLDEQHLGAITGSSEPLLARVMSALDISLALGIRTKLNVVLLEETADSICDLAALACERDLDVRFIELMPIGEGISMRGIAASAALSILRDRWPDLQPSDERHGNGPAQYYRSNSIKGSIGLIHAVSAAFCGSCNRIRLTSTGGLKPCLCYEEGQELLPLLRGGKEDREIIEIMCECIWSKPQQHCFSQPWRITEVKKMSQIGG